MKELYFPHLATEQAGRLYGLTLSNSCGLLAEAGALERKEFLRAISLFRANVAVAASRLFGREAALYAIECQSAPALVDEPPIILSQLSLTEEQGKQPAYLLYLEALLAQEEEQRCDKLRQAFAALGLTCPEGDFATLEHAFVNLA